jgi:hypothetical protein
MKDMRKSSFAALEIRYRPECFWLVDTLRRKGLICH